MMAMCGEIWRWWGLVAVLLCLTACSTDDLAQHQPGEPMVCSEGDQSPGPDGRCEPGSWPDVNGCCQVAGLPLDMLCPPGEQPTEAGTCCPAGTVPLADGNCQPAGIAPNQCAEGFVHDGDVSCEPILPAEDCADGWMAVPGDTECHEVAPCGEGTWGDIPVEGNTEYVDGSYDGINGPSNGSLMQPWTVIADGVMAAEPGAIVAVAAGSYNESLTIYDKPVRLWGRCPAMVEVGEEGPALDNLNATVNVLGAMASGTEVRQLSVTGEFLGIQVVSAQGVVVDRVRVHHVQGWGMRLLGPSGPSQVVVSNSLIEHCQRYGVLVSGDTHSLIDKNVVRDTLADGDDGNYGHGVNIGTSNAGRPQVTVSGSLVERNQQFGLRVKGADVAVEGVVVRDTLPGKDDWGDGINVGPRPVGTGVEMADFANVTLRGSVVERNRRIGVVINAAEALVEGLVVRDTSKSPNGGYGYGMHVTANGSGVRSNATLRGSVIERNHNYGLIFTGSDGVVEGVVVRDTLSAGAGTKGGRGVQLQPDSVAGARSSVTLKGSLVEGNQEIGLVVFGSDAFVEGVMVRDTLPNEDGTAGFGVAAFNYPGASDRSSVAVSSSVIEDNRVVGMAIVESDAIMDRAVVRGTQPSNEGEFGHGVEVLNEPDGGVGASLSLTASLVERNRGFGVLIGDSEAIVDRAAIVDTSTDDHGSTGDGIGIFSFEGVGVAHVESTSVESSARAGVSNWGAEVALSAVRLECNSIEVNGEIYQGQSDVFHSLGDSVCGCPEQSQSFDECRVESSNLEPPKPVEPEQLPESDG